MKINCDRSCTLSETLLGAHWVGPRDLVKQRIYPTKTSLPALAALEITHLAVFTFQLYRLTCYLSNRVHCIGIHEIIATSWIIRNSITSSTSLGTNNQRSLMPPQHSWHVTILTLTGLNVLASWMPHGFDWASLMMTWGHLGHSGLLWHTLSYSGIFLHTLT